MLQRNPSVLFALALAFTVSLARAENCLETETRLSFVSERLQADSRDAQRWTLGWGVGYAALALGQAGLALTRDDPGERAELFVGAGESVLGLVPLLLLPVPAIRDAERLDARLVASAGGERCALVREAEHLLRRSAEDETFARGWVAHTLTVGINGGGLLIVGLGYDRWASGIAGALLGIAIGELQIFTRPTSAMRGLGTYESRWTAALMWEPGVAGVRLTGVLDPK
jgi:hypothetical protein